jgi:hypothetical protein
VTNLSLALAVTVFFVSGLSMAGQTSNPNAGSWSGVIINNNCSADEAFAEAAKCTEKNVPGAKFILYDRYYPADVPP